MVFILKSILTFVLFCLAVSLYGQETSLANKVEKLKSEIEVAQGGHKLELLDSLCNLVRYEKEYDYESFAKRAIQTADELDSINLKLKHANNLIQYYNFEAFTPEKGSLIYKNSLKDSLKAEKIELLAKLNFNGGNSFLRTKKTDSAISAYKKAVDYALISKDSSTMVLAKNNQAIAEMSKSNYAEATNLFTQTVQLRTLLKDTTGIVTSRNLLAIAYNEMGFYEQAQKERVEVIKLARQLANNDGNYYPILVNLFHTARNAENLGDQKSRIEYLKEGYEYSLKALDSPDPKYKSQFKYDYLYAYGLLSAYSQLDSLNKADMFYSKVQTAVGEISPIPFSQNYREALVDYYFAKKEYQKALEEAQNLMKIRTPNSYIENGALLHKKIADIYDGLGNVDSSYYHYKEYSVIKDSIQNAKKTNALSYYQTIYETEKQENKIKQQKSEIELLDTKNKAKSLWIILGSLGAILLMTFLYFWYKQNMKVRALENEKLNSEIEYKQKDLTNLAVNISSNQEWAESLAEKLEVLKASTGKKRAKELESLEAEIKNKIWVNNNSDDFYKKIDDLSSSFYDKLNTQFEGLTKTDIRLCSLIKLKLNTKQIATLQNINPSSVKMSRNRLRKKLNLSPEDDLDAFLHSL